MLRIDDIPQQVADDMHGVAVIEKFCQHSHSVGAFFVLRTFLVAGCRGRHPLQSIIHFCVLRKFVQTLYYLRRDAVGEEARRFRGKVKPCG